MANKTRLKCFDVRFTHDAEDKQLSVLVSAGSREEAWHIVKNWYKYQRNWEVFLVNMIQLRKCKRYALYFEESYYQRELDELKFLENRYNSPKGGK